MVHVQKDRWLAVCEPMAGASGGVQLRVKVVPGASRSKVVGLLGDRLKVSVSAPPEAGKANKAVCTLIAEALGLTLGEVTVMRGPTSPTKTLHLSGVTLDEVSIFLDAQAGGGSRKRA